MKLWTTLCVLACLLSGLAACSDSDAPKDSKVEEGASTARQFRFEYSVELPKFPGKSKVQVWIPLASDELGVQRLSELSIQSEGATVEETTDPVYGNRMLHVLMKEPAQGAKVSWSALVAREIDTGGSNYPLLDAHLQANLQVPITGPATEIAQKLGTLGGEMPVAERARKVYDDVLNSMSYDKSVPGYGAGDFIRAVEICKGNCTDFHARFIGTCRASGIPARFNMGIPIKDTATGEYRSYHCWAHWWDGAHWNPVDISEADKVVAKDPEAADRFFGNIDQHRITLSTGRDLVLSPPQAGDPLNYFVFPHVEADGQKVEIPSSSWSFSWGPGR